MVLTSQRTLREFGYYVLLVKLFVNVKSYLHIFSNSFLEFSIWNTLFPSSTQLDIAYALSCVFAMVTLICHSQSRCTASCSVQYINFGESSLRHVFANKQHGWEQYFRTLHYRRIQLYLRNDEACNLSYRSRSLFSVSLCASFLSRSLDLIFECIAA